MNEKIGNPANTEVIPVFCSDHERVGNLKFKINGALGIKADQKNKKEGTMNANKVVRKRVYVKPDVINL